MEEDELLPNFNSSISYPPESSKSKEALLTIHKAVDNKKKTKTDVEVGTKYPGDHVHKTVGDKEKP